jgi:hypothetical protein
MSRRMLMCLATASLSLVPLAATQAEDLAPAKEPDPAMTQAPAQPAVECASDEIQKSKEVGVRTGLFDGDGGAMLNLAYRKQQGCAVSRGDYVEGNRELNLEGGIGVVYGSDKTTHVIGRADISKNKGWLTFDGTIVDSDSHRVRYLSPTFGYRHFYGPGNSNAGVSVTPLSMQHDSASGVDNVRTGVDAFVTHEFNPQLKLKADVGAALLWNLIGSDTAKNAKAALIYTPGSIGENPVILSLEAVAERNHYARTLDTHPAGSGPETNTLTIAGSAAVLFGGKAHQR